MSIGNLSGTYEHLIVSPTSLKQNVLRLIDEEIEKGENGRIVMKMNSLTDVDFIDKISQAWAGVKVDLIVGNLLHPARSSRIYREYPCHEYRGKIPGASKKDFLLRDGSRAENIHRISGYDDPEYRKAGGGSMPDPG